MHKALDANVLQPTAPAAPKGVLDTLQLEVDRSPAPDEQRRAIQDALRLLAVWAIRAAKQAPSGADSP